MTLPTRIRSVAGLAAALLLAGCLGPTAPTQPSTADYNAARDAALQPPLSGDAPLLSSDEIAAAFGPVPRACASGPARPAARNAANLRRLSWYPFGRLETGWEIYEPMIAREIHTDCRGHTPRFAAALAGWQRAHRLRADGVVSLDTFLVMKTGWQRRRPFVAVSQTACPPPPAESDLVLAGPADSLEGSAVRLRPGVLAAWRRMAAAARRAAPEVAADPRLLTIFSGYRSPDYDAARCQRDQNCNGVSRAACSPHRTGLAVDLYMGAAPGYPPDSSADANRLYMVRTQAYRWMLANARRYGFVNYAFEPWHWEWVGERP